jgi:hypothetical protein
VFVEDFGDAVLATTASLARRVEVCARYSFISKCVQSVREGKEVRVFLEKVK